MKTKNNSKTTTQKQSSLAVQAWKKRKGRKN
jgi:hypothetical protein